MSKITTLCSKASLFERLATYGSRAQFLESLAYQGMDSSTFSESRKFLQLAKDLLKDNSEVLNSLSSKTKNVYIKFYPVIQSAPSDEEELQKQLSVLKTISTLILQESKGELANKKPETLGLSIKRYVDSALNSIRKFQEQQQMEDAWLSQQPSEAVNSITNDTPFTSAPKTISPSVQRALNGLLGIKLNADGLLGPQTATALQLFRSQFNNNKNISDPSLYEDIMTEYANKTSPIIRQTPF